MSDEKKLIALTFDDGPDRVATVSVLDTLEKYGCRASFFLIADNISEDTEDIVRRETALGHEVNNHSRTHGYMDKMSAEDIRAEIGYTDEIIIRLTGKRPVFFRPPYIAVSDRLFETVEKPFICGIGSNDWEDDVSAEQIAESVLRQAHDGAIMLLHDAKDNSRTPEAVKTIVPALLERGYELVTLGELFRRKGETPKRGGILYSRVPQDK
ncbi:MAG: polysaccharide deacetylase family protein [Ruminococcus sp.]|nr:polysaccharide deacetylase family protein [Ruminococcus sp.]